MTLQASSEKKKGVHVLIISKQGWFEYPTDDYKSNRFQVIRLLKAIFSFENGCWGSPLSRSFLQLMLFASQERVLDVTVSAGCKIDWKWKKKSAYNLTLILGFWHCHRTYFQWWGSRGSNKATRSMPDDIIFSFGIKSQLHILLAIIFKENQLNP